MERIRKSCRMVLMEPVPPVDQLTALIVEVARRNAWQEDVFIRPSFYKSTRAIGVASAKHNAVASAITTP